ncbi:GMP synthase (glutamine-hydrolysing) [Sphingopyxis sp. YR583]|jgi:GMP synthase (glutamine-hydrolysing)|uniref:glutamine amidotransferase n=1 Tax=Sphingopyxis sp. YR583 TaxID=1881047 RepID=UPI0008A7DBA3|nr:glutamine amidotransferase [Sphingopyxis sp. YR583]SEH12206.1 GMP synthase (glutamine-hydrolysing) [Sphingopyxis sp. YR583]
MTSQPTRKTGLIIRHVPHEGIAGYRAPIEAAGYALDRIDVSDAGFGALDLTEPDLLIMMGGPMGVYERNAHPWIACQLRRLARRIEAGRPTLGVCFGAQMMAAAMGANVYPGPAKEVGFHALSFVDPSSPLRHLADVPVLHWHGDTFDLPADVELLASTAAYPHQAFRRGNNILALQFHGEMGLDPRFDEWLRQWPDALAETGGSVEGMRELHRRFGPHAVDAGRTMISEWLAGLS